MPLIMSKIALFKTGLCQGWREREGFGHMLNQQSLQNIFIHTEKRVIFYTVFLFH